MRVRTKEDYDRKRHAPLRFETGGQLLRFIRRERAWMHRWRIRHGVAPYEVEFSPGCRAPASGDWSSYRIVKRDETGKPIETIPLSGV